MDSTTGSSHRRQAGSGWRQAVRALELCALCSLGVAYPLFQVLTASPEFFVARNTTLPILIAATLAFCLALPLLVALLELLASVVDARASTALHYAVLCVLVALTTMPWTKRIAALDSLLSIVVACLAAAASASLHRRWAGVRTFVLWLAPAVVLVPALFIWNQDVYDAAAPTPQTFESPDIESAPPIVFVVFDELPLNSLLDDRYAVDVVRYPRFAQLAADSFWFRNTHTVHARTVRAVPAILSGLYPNPRAVPTAQYYPNNLFTLLADAYEMTSFATFARLCPEGACTHDIHAPKESVSALLSDFAIVYLHVVLPTELAQRNFPPIVGDWQSFAPSVRGWREWQRLQNEARDAEEQSTVLTLESEFDRFAAEIGPEKERRLYFLHMLLPHAPFEYVPSGHRYRGPTTLGLSFFNTHSQAFADVVHQRHLLQVGFVDTLVGRLVDRLQEVGIYDESLIIITADHGASFRAGTDFRQLADDNYSDIMLVPLFVKLPGQIEGAISDRSVALIDIVPTIADVLAIEMPYEVDGRSLIDFESVDTGHKTVVDSRLSREQGSGATDSTTVRHVTVDDAIEHSYVAWEHKLSVFGSGDRYGLYSIGSDLGLIGQRVDAHTSSEDSPLVVTLSNMETFGDVKIPSASLPLHVAGSIDGDSSSPYRVAVGVNGRIAAITVPYLEDGTVAFSTMIPAEFLESGSNKVDAFVLDEQREEPRLLRGSRR